ncbi:hypothetical protein [Algoriphagus limi]|uniref:Uncharacterized protein n=1 Tax=Algoriphagus limi TaxID=2975273 RepID=A0ABT2G4L9_9BACT|nr:hypothetical protein [Algoriphagus limi]MCS5488902.1 hypothetical protein [Algoriphagus limi]
MENQKLEDLKNEFEKELDRAFVNVFLSPKYDDHISLEDDSFFEKIYGKENFEKMMGKRKKDTDNQNNK